MTAHRSAEAAGIATFSIGRLPRIEFGRGRFALVPDVVARHGRRALVVTGGHSFRATERWPWLLAELERRAIVVDELVVTGEPSPGAIDDAVGRFGPAGIEVVLAIGGGSVLDAGKAVAGLLRTGTSVMDHLEVVGRGVPYPGPAVPLVAVPTTAGTGSEATKNAVISEQQPGGFKRSFRDDALVATDAIVDPDLLAGAPPSLIAANGLDALTQLLESYVSLRAGAFTDALALSGFEAARDGLLAWHADADGPGVPAARSRMAYAALVSGICLAHAGLGVMHGLAAPLGALHPVPHGVACGATLAAGVTANVRALEERAPESPALARFAALGRLLGRLPGSVPDAAARSALVDLLRSWTARLGIGGLAGYGVTEAAIPRLVAESRAGSMKTNPIELTDEELAGILRASL
jgi:alcohol dehydrogenase